jgi:hypothetical protein
VVKGEVPVFAGAIAPATADTVQVAIDAKEVGADGIFVIPPMGAIDVTTAWDSFKYPEVWLELLKALRKGVGDMPFICHPTGTQSIRYGEGLPVELGASCGSSRICRVENDLTPDTGLFPGPSGT